MKTPRSPDLPLASQEQQKELRVRTLRRRNQLTPEESACAAEKIAHSVCHSTWFQRSKNIACYLPMAGEVDTWRIIARAWSMKKRVFAPIIQKKKHMTFQEITPDTALYMNSFGVYEPRQGKFIAARLLDVVITPLLAFDSNNHRIGFGGGYFDRTFAFLKHRTMFYRPKLIGVAFACQKVEKIAANPWDVRLFRIVTDMDCQSGQA